MVAFVVVAALVAAGGSTHSLTPHAAAAADPVIAAAGDIACDPTNANFNGGNGSSDSCRQKYTSDLLVNGSYAAVLSLGDNQYYCGGYTAFLNSYDQSWGRVKAATHPVVGNHEYLTSGGTDCNSANAGADGYFKYFGTAAGVKGQGYYSYDVGTWHLVALNSNCGDAGGCGATSPQGVWLKNDLAAHTNVCTLAYWHIPLYSSGGRAASNTQPLWQILYDNNADLALTAHDHLYERFAPQRSDATLDTTRGIREFVVGTGGANHTSFTSTIAKNSEVRNDSTYGILELTLHPTSYDWHFKPEAGKTFSDSGTTSCHGSTSDITAPTAPTNLVATTASAGRVDLGWSASTDDTGVAGYRIYRNGSQIGVSTTTSYADTTAQPATTYSYYVVAYDSSNNPSAASNTASATTPPDTAPPSVDLAWAASTDDVGVVGYRIYRDGAQIGTSTGSTYVDQTTQATTSYTYVVVAYDSTGNTSAASAPAAVTTPAPPTTLTFSPAADTYVESDLPTTNFGTATTIIADNSPIKTMLLRFAVSGISGRQVLSAKLRLYCVDPSSVGGTFHRVADTSWNESTVNWNTAPAGDATTLASLGAVAANTWYELDVTKLVSGDGAVSVNATSTSSDGAHYASKEGAAGFAPQLIVTTSSAPADTTSPTPPTNLLADATNAGRIDLSWTSSTDDVGVVGYKVFRNGAQLGTATTTTFADLSAQPATTYSYTVAAYDAAGNTSAASDPAVVTTAPDTTPPSAPGNVVATAVGPTQVNLSWSSSTDDVGVASYSVVRDTQQVGTSQTTSFADTTVQPSTTYSYTVIAVDRAGNVSAPSAVATATTPSPSSTLTFTPTDDTYVQSDLPASNFGKTTTIVADNKPIRNMLLKFAVAGVGSRKVTSAKLRLFCVDGSPVGGTLHRVADTSWTEGSVTWNTAPAADAATIGSLGGVSAQTWYEVDVTSLIAGDGTYSVNATSTSSNGAYYSSKEGSFAPQLVITTS